jgi:hypothetical protein
MSSLPIQSEEELTIDSVHGLKSFLSYVEDAYQACLAQAAVSDAPATASVVSHLEAVHAEINALVTRYVKILDWGGEISVDQAELLQQFYNQIIEAYDTLTEAQQQSPKAALINQVETATFLLERGVRLLENFSEIQTTTLSSPTIQAGKESYAALQQNCTDAKIIFDAIEGTVHTATLEDATMIATNQAEGLADIERTFDVLEKNLTTLFESGALEEAPAQVVPVRDQRGNRTQSKEVQTLFGPYINNVIAQQTYATVVKETFSSPSAFEASLRREVYRVEAPSKLDALLGIKHGSAFLFLKDMTLAEIDVFDGQKNRQDIRARLQQENIPYEIYMNWMEAIVYMESLVQSTDEMTFGELFVRSEVELLLHAKNNSNAQGVYK